MEILSAGAVEPGLVAALAEFEKASGVHAAVTFNTAPQVRSRIAKGESFDVVSVPPALMEMFAREGHAGARCRDLRDAAARAARPERVVFNRATGGQYIESTLKKIGRYAEIERRTVRYDSAGQVMQHLARGAGREIGFGPITEIMLYASKGVRYVAPLPPEVQHRNAYVASVMRGAANARDAAALLRFLTTPAARAVLAAGGVEP